MRALAVLLWSLGVLLVWPGDALAQLFAPPVVSSFELVNGSRSEGPDVLVPITLKPDCSVKRVYSSRILMGDKSRPSFIAAFVPAWKNGRLEITVRFDQIRAPVIWTVTVNFEGTVSGKEEELTQALDLQLVLPPPKLRPIPPVVLRDRRWPWGESPWGKPVVWTITLHELAGTTLLQDLRIEQVEPTISGDAQIDAKLEAVDPPKELAAAGKATVRLVGTDFPIGTSKGKITIDGAQIDQPIDVPFEIRTEVFDEIIIPVFLLSGLLGWLLRHLLKNEEARAELRARLEPLRGRVQEQIENHPTPDRVVVLKSKMEAVDAAIAAGDDAAAQAAVVALRAELDTALGERQAVVAEGLRKVGPLRQALSASFDLPETVDLAPLRKALAECEAALTADAPKKANALIDSISELFAAFGGNVNSWADRARARLDEFTADPPVPRTPLLPAALRRVTADLAAAAKKALADLPAYDPASPPDPFTDFLRAAHAACWQTRRLVENLCGGFEAEVESTVYHLKKAGKTDEGIQRAGAAGQVPAGLRTADPAQALDQLARLSRAFGDALAGLITTAEAKKLLQTGDFAAAAAMEKATLSGEQDGGAAGFRATPPRPPVESAPAVQMPAPRLFVFHGAAPLDPISLSRARLEKIKVARGLLSAGILSVLAWIFYRAAWIGTPQDFAGVAVVGFFSDFTLDAVIEAVNKVKKPVQP